MTRTAYYLKWDVLSDLVADDLGLEEIQGRATVVFPDLAQGERDAAALQVVRELVQDGVAALLDIETRLHVPADVSDEVLESIDAWHRAPPSHPVWLRATPRARVLVYQQFPQDALEWLRESQRREVSRFRKT